MAEMNSKGYWTMEPERPGPVESSPELMAAHLRGRASVLEEVYTRVNALDSDVKVLKENDMSDVFNKRIVIAVKTPEAIKCVGIDYRG